MAYPSFSPDWLIDCQPREVQIEALSRSYYGIEQRNSRFEEPLPFRARQGPAKKWGHWLEMRLGKTPTTLAEFSLFERDHGIDKALIFAPNSYKKAWCREGPGFGLLTPFIPFETSKVHLAEAELRKAKGRAIVVMNHEALQHDAGRQFMADFVDNRTYLAVDESIKLKNHNSMATTFLTPIAKEAAVVRTLTGLPFTQGPQDMFAQLRLMGATGNRVFHAWRNRYCEMGGFKNKAVVGVKEDRKKELWDVVNSTTFYAKRIDWADRVEATQATFDVGMTEKQQAHYNQIAEDFVTVLDSGEIVSVNMVVTSLMKMQQITSGFIIDEAGNAHDLVHPHKVPKILRLLELIEDEAGPRKIVVPYFYQKSGEVLEEVLAKYNPAAIHRASLMKATDRDPESEKARFFGDSSCRVMITQMTSGKYGHDLTGPPGDRADLMVFYENTYSLDDRIQIEARITAAKQDWPVMYADFVSGGVNRSAIRALQRKDDIVTAVVGDRGRFRYEL